MAYTLILHLGNQAPVVGEVDELPKPTDNLIILSNPRTREGKDLSYIEPNVTRVIWPVSAITLIEILEAEEEEEIIGFVRE
ncbi:MAG: hypothetical protein J7555_02155 [Chloroflexi bacterium]|jgi:hypothetical protein|nr:hypothetical protein [Chloroflexota bacterium]